MRLILLFVSTLLLTSCLKGAGSSTGGRAPIPPVPSPLSVPDKIELNGAVAQQITLPNNLKVTLVSSPTSKKSAAAVAVRVGHRDNPVEHQGLAHYLEHMLFLGTDEFPEVGSYKEFLNQNNGGSNAYTSGNHTNYYLEVRSDKFDEAVHRLSRFFVSPKFYKENIEAEKSAVHNEFNFRFETFKEFRIVPSFLKESDPSRLFSIGNYVSLSETTAEDTRAFFEEHYHTESMHAVLAGPQTLEDLENLAYTYFSDFQSKPDRKLPEFSEFDEFDFSKLPAKVLFKPRGAEKKLKVFIPVRNPIEIKPKLSMILGTLIGDESEDSLMAALQREGLAKSGAGVLSGGAGASGVSVSVILTEKGTKDQLKVLKMVRGYVDFLLATGLPSYINDEIDKSISSSKYSQTFYEVSGDLVQTLNREYMSGKEFPKNLEELLFGKDLEEVTAEDYKNYLQSLSWDKLLVTYIDSENEELPYNLEANANKEIGGLKIQEVNGELAVTDSIFEFVYKIESLETEQIKPIGQYTLKRENKYLPQSFELYPDAGNELYQKVLLPGGMIRYSSLTDTKLAKTFIDLRFFSSGVDFEDPKDVISTYLLRELLRLQTSNSTYQMITAGFNYNLPLLPMSGAIGLSFEGWSDTFLTAFNDLIAMANIDVSEQTFNAAKDLYSKNIKIERSGGVDGIGVRAMRSQIELLRPSYNDIDQNLPLVTYEYFNGFVDRFFSNLHYKGALSGNIKPNTMEGVLSAIEKAWSPRWLDENEWSNLGKVASLLGPDVEGGKLPLYETTLYGNDPNESFYYGYLNFGKPKNQKEKLIIKILGSWLSPDFYTELRTRREMAYGLNAWAFDHGDYSGIAVYLQSSTKSVDDVETAVLDYIKSWSQKELTQKKPIDLVKAKASFRLSAQMPMEPSQLHTKYVSFVDEEYDSIEEYMSLLDPLDSISLDEVIQYGQTKLSEQNPKSGSFVKVKRKIQ